MTTFSTSDSGKAVVEDATVKIAVNDLSDIRPEEPILLCKSLIIDLFQRFEVVLNAPVVW